MAKDITKIAHPEYVRYMADYMMIRDCFRGARAIKDAADLYLPRLSGQSEDDYKNYKTRALFFPITGKTATTMVGLATTKPPKVQIPVGMESYFADTESDYQFTEFYVGVFTEVILMGRYGVLIDAPPPPAQGDPTLVPYIAENILRWEFSGGVMVDLLLREHVYVRGDQQFEMKQVCRYRHCYINAAGIYTTETLDDELKLIPGTMVTPMFSGETITYIPFTPFGASGIHYSVDKPPMLDISTINISHYMSSADLEWGRHLTGLPTPVVSGVDSSTSLKIGGTAAWILPPAEAKAYFMEFLGQGLQSLEKAMVEKVSLMASVSARMIDNSTRGSEAAETVRLRYMSESAGLIHIINAVESGLTMMYNMLARLRKASSPVVIQFSREIIGLGIQFKDLKILFDAYLQGGISKETLLFNLRRLEAIDPNRTDSDELAAIRDPAPPATNNPPAATPPNSQA